MIQCMTMFRCLFIVLKIHCHTYFSIYIRPNLYTVPWRIQTEKCDHPEEFKQKSVITPEHLQLSLTGGCVIKWNIQYLDFKSKMTKLQLVYFYHSWPKHCHLDAKHRSLQLPCRKYIWTILPYPSFNAGGYGNLLLLQIFEVNIPKLSIKLLGAMGIYCST